MGIFCVDDVGSIGDKVEVSFGNLYGFLVDSFVGIGVVEAVGVLEVGKDVDVEERGERVLNIG